MKTSAKERVVPGRYKWSISAMLAIVCVGAWAAQLTQQQVDFAVASRYQKPGMPARNLRNGATRFADGAKGYEIYVPSSTPAGGFAPFESMEKSQLHAQYCLSSTIVLARNTSSTAYLSSAKDQVVTASDFVVEEILKPDPGVTIGKSIIAIRLGGDVTDGSEALRVRVRGRPDFKPGGDYLLFLDGIGANYPSIFHANDYVTVSISDGTVNPSHFLWFGFFPGESYASFKEQLSALTTNHPCK